MVERVSTFGLGQSLLRLSMSTQARYAAATEQQASGLVGATYGELGAKAATLIASETAGLQLATWQANTETANARVEAMYAAVGDLVDLLTSARSTLAAAKSSSESELDMAAAGTALLDDLAEAMNTRQDGRYLFAGGNALTAPVEVAALAAATVPSFADTAYYTGDGAKASVRVSAEQTITYGVTAGDDAFEKALRAANIMAAMTASPVDQDAVSEAYDLATEAMDALIAIQSGLSTVSGRLEAAQSRQSDALDLLDALASDIKGVDVAAVTVKLANYQTQLQASYSALGNINQLSLTDFL